MSRSSSSSRGTRLLKRVVITVLVVANLLVGFAYWRLSSVQSVIAQTAKTDTEVVDVLDTTGGGSQEALTFLLVGSDSRAGLGDLTNFANVGGQRSDVMILLKLIPSEGRALMLSLPRDLWVDIEGHGQNRLNAAYSFGGASLLVDTIKNETGIAINHYVEVDFVGFQAIVDQLGGVTIEFAYPARDTSSGLDVAAGSQRLDGKMALAYARSRHYQEYRDGSWVSVDATDIGRNRRQQQLIFAILREAKRPGSIAEAGSIAQAFARHLTLDANLIESSFLRLAFQMRNISSADIEAATLPVTGTTIDGKSVLLRKQPDADATLAIFAQGGHFVASDSGPGNVSVLNANGIAGSAGATAALLRSKGVTVVSVGDADALVGPQTKVIVRPGDFARGQALVDLLGYGAVEEGTLSSTIDALVLVGGDYRSSG